MYKSLLASFLGFAVASTFAGQDPVPRPAPAAPPAPAASIEQPKTARFGPEALTKLGWLSGTWVTKQGEVVTEEHWRPLQGNTLLGSSHTFRGERTLAFEFLRITAARDQVGYVAMPGGKAPTTFVLEKLEDGVAEFVDAKHDFPQRIRYERTEKGLTATISLLDGTKAQPFVFTKKE